jgi:hypothetical protein
MHEIELKVAAISRQLNALQVVEIRVVGRKVDDDGAIRITVGLQVGDVVELEGRVVVAAVIQGRNPCLQRFGRIVRRSGFINASA